ncbi:MAG: putative Ig domain-containing protein [Nitrospirota bacterium]
MAAAVAFGCSSESSPPGQANAPSPAASSGPRAQGNRPPIVRSAVISPNPILPGELVQVLVEGDDPDGEPVTYRLQWLANNFPIAGATRPALMPSMLKRGDLLSVEVVPSDSFGEGAPYRTEALPFPNTPPEVTHLTIQPGEPRLGDRIQVEAEGRDADQDPVRYTFRWLRNDQPMQEGESPSLETSGFEREDAIAVEVTPHDEAGPGKPFRSPPVKILNNDPVITSTPPAAVEQGRFEYRIVAADREGDPLTYVLEVGPPGMTMDSKTGRLEWRLPAETKGRHRVRVAVRDSRSGYAFQEFDLDLTSGS